MIPKVLNRRLLPRVSPNGGEVIMPPGAIYVGRPTKWGNPFRVPQGADLDGSKHRAAVERFRVEVLPTLDCTELRGHDLVCWCAPLPCHADLLLEKANQ